MLHLQRPLNMVIIRSLNLKKEFHMAITSRTVRSESSKGLVIREILISIMDQSMMTREDLRAVTVPSKDLKLVAGMHIIRAAMWTTETRSDRMKISSRQYLFQAMTFVMSFLISIRDPTSLITIQRTLWSIQITSLAKCIWMVTAIVTDLSILSDSQRSTWLRVWMWMLFNLPSQWCFTTCSIKGISVESK